MCATTSVPLLYIHGWAFRHRYRNFRHSDTVWSRSWRRSWVSKVRGSKVFQVEVSEVQFWVPAPRLCLKNADDILHLKWKWHLHLTVCFTFLEESRRHLELFAAFRMNCLNSPTQSWQKFSRVQKRWNKRQYSNWCCRGNICFSGSWVHITLVDSDILFPIVCFVSIWTNTWQVSLETRAEASRGDCDVILGLSTPISVESEVTGQEAEIQSSLGDDDTSVLSLPDTMAQELSEDETNTAANTSELNAFLGSGVLNE